jgi:hypothetical protein
MWVMVAAEALGYLLGVGLWRNWEHDYLSRNAMRVRIPSGPLLEIPGWKAVGMVTEDRR